jgi:CspA family cold shock protein
MAGQQTGVVKWFDANKGYGFIKRDGAGDLFVHANDLRRSGITSGELEQGDEVMFEEEVGNNGKPRAINLVLTD